VAAVEAAAGVVPRPQGHEAPGLHQQRQAVLARHSLQLHAEVEAVGVVRRLRSDPVRAEDRGASGRKDFRS
jgi:hypothetical protein